MFGSLERGLDKMINMLTPNRKRGLREGPRKIKVDLVTHLLARAPPPHDPLNNSPPCMRLRQVQYNVTLTSQTDPDQVLNQILSILPEKNIDFTQKG